MIHYGGLGNRVRPNAEMTPPAWMVAAARRAGPAIADAAGVHLGRTTVTEINGLNALTELHERQQAARLEQAAHREAPSVLGATALEGLIAAQHLNGAEVHVIGIADQDMLPPAVQQLAGGAVARTAEEMTAFAAQPPHPGL